MKKTINWALALSYVLLVSCDADHDKNVPELDTFTNGVFLVNEGNFLRGNGTLSFYSSTDNQVTPDVFEKFNTGKSLGDVVQSAYLDEDKKILFMVVNNSNRLFAIDVADSLKIIFENLNLNLPRYCISVGSTLFVTEWVSFSDPGRLSVIDIGTGEITKQLNLGFGAENIELVGNELIISNSFESSLSVVDIQSLAVTKTVQVGFSPSALMYDGNALYVLKSGGFDENFLPANDGALFKLEINQLMKTDSVSFNSNTSSRWAVNSSKEFIYVPSSQKVFEIRLSDLSLLKTNEYPDFIGIYGIGVDSKDRIWLSDAMGFQTQSLISVYSLAGVKEISFSSGGIGTNSFIFLP